MRKYSDYDYILGIDPGTHTGICIYSPFSKKIISLKTTFIHKAILEVIEYSKYKILVRMEDARLRKWYGNNAHEKMQGAGSIKRDCSIWEDFLSDFYIPLELVQPKNIKTKLAKLAFKKITGYEGRTSAHSRDAGMIVFGL